MGDRTGGPHTGPEDSKQAKGPGGGDSRHYSRAGQCGPGHQALFLLRHPIGERLWIPLTSTSPLQDCPLSNRTVPWAQSRSPLGGAHRVTYLSFQDRGGWHQPLGWVQFGEEGRPFSPGAGTTEGWGQLNSPASTVRRLGCLEGCAGKVRKSFLQERVQGSISDVCPGTTMSSYAMLVFAAWLRWSRRTRQPLKILPNQLPAGGCWGLKTALRRPLGAISQANFRRPSLSGLSRTPGLQVSPGLPGRQGGEWAHQLPWLVPC